MAPSREEMLQRISRLPKQYQQAAIQALNEEVKDFSSHSAAPVSSLGGGFLTPFPFGYVTYLKSAPVEVLREIASRLRYWGLPWEHRQVIRERLGLDTAGIVKLQEERPFYVGGLGLINPSERTGPRQPASTSRSTGGSRRRSGRGR